MFKGQHTQTFFLLFLAFLALYTIPADAALPVVTDFEDGTSQGWKMQDYSASNHKIVPQGNPGYALLALDTKAGSPNPRLIAPPSYCGDLSLYEGIQWDEYIFYESHIAQRTLPIILFGQDGTRYVSKAVDGPLNVWKQRYVPFEEQYWTHHVNSGSMSFKDVIKDVAAMHIHVDCSWAREEAMVDNIILVPKQTVIVSVDIKPTSCPNPLNVKSKGVLPVAILGSDVFDVNEIDVASLEILGVKPIRSSYEDVAAPVAKEALAEECACTTEGPDGYMDLTLKFDKQEIIEAIGEVEDGDEVILTLTGMLTDETPIEGTDCIWIIKKGKQK